MWKITRRINFKARNFTKLQWLGCLLGLLLAAASADAQRKSDIVGKVNPGQICPGNDMCVEWAQDGVARAEYLTDFFYAVVLKTTERCGATEKERLKFQALFPKNKVFLEEVACGFNDAEKRTSYSGIGDSEHSFIAVYAGKNKTEAEKFLKTVKATGKFPGANLRKTRVILHGT